MKKAHFLSLESLLVSFLRCPNIPENVIPLMEGRSRIEEDSFDGDRPANGLFSLLFTQPDVLFISWDLSSIRERDEE